MRPHCRSAGRCGLYRIGELWVALGEGPAFDDYASGSGQNAEQALRRERSAARAARERNSRDSTLGVIC